MTKTSINHKTSHPPTKKSKSSLTLANLKSIRKEQKLTLQKLSNLAKISPSYLSRLETGARRFNTDILEKLSTVLNCHPSDLLKLDDNSTSKNKNKAILCFSSKKDLPIYRSPISHLKNTMTAQGYTIDFKTPFDWIYRPKELEGSRKAFAVFVQNHYLVPKYSFGDTLYIHTTKSLTQGCSVIAIKKDNNVLIGKYDEKLKDGLILRTFSHQRQFYTISSGSLRAVYRIIGSLERSE